jgi:DNA polymerase-3 subunit beta
MKLKTLVSLAKGRTTIPILGTVRVQDGIATATDLDYHISTPVTGFNKKDGDEDLTYYPHGFDKGVFTKTELPASDFPDHKPSGKDRLTVTLDAKQLEAFAWILKAASKEETRYYLNGIYFDKGDIVATDGHRLHTMQCKLDWNKKATVGAILPRHGCKLILDLVKETKASSVTITFQDMTFTATIGEVTLQGKLIDGTFPEWEKVVPKTVPGNKTIHNPADLKAIKPAIDILCKITATRRPSVKLHNGTIEPTFGAMLATKHSWPTSMKTKCEIGFNLNYLMDACGGTVFYNTSSDPVKIIDQRGGITKMTVLMPLRV